MNNPQQFIVKITFTQSGDTRRVQFVAPPSFDDLKTRCHVLFAVSPHEAVTLTYNDCEDDTITIANDADVGLAFLSRPQNECLRIVFSVRPKPTLPNAPFHTHPFQHTNFHRDFRYQHVPPVELHQSPFDQPRGRFRRGEKKKPFWTDRKWKFDDSVLKDQINSMVSDIQAFFAPAPKEHTQQHPQPVAASADPTSNDEPRVVQTGDHTPHSPSAPLAPYAVFPAVPSHPCPVAPTQSAVLTDAAGQTYHPMPDVWHPDRQHNPQQPLPQTIHRKEE